MIIEHFLDNNLVRRFSDKKMKIRQMETGILYNEAVDVLPCRYTYEESNELVDASLEPEITDEIPEWRSPEVSGVQYSVGSKVMHNGSQWICTIDGNLWEPGQEGWDLDE